MSSQPPFVALPEDAVFAALLVVMLAALALSRDRVTAAAVAFGVALPLYELPGSAWSWAPALSLVTVAAVALGVVAVAHGQWGVVLERALGWRLLAVAAFLGWVTASASAAGASGASRYELARLVGATAIMVVVAVAVTSSRARQGLAAGLVAAMSLVSAVAVVQFAWGRFIWSIGRTSEPGYDYFIEVVPGIVRAAGVFHHPHKLGLFCATATVMAAHLAGRSAARARRLLMAAGVLLVLGLGLSMTRSSVLGLAIGLVVLWIRWPVPRRWLVVGAVLLALLLAVSVVRAPWFSPAPETTTSAGHRLIYWGAAARMAIDHPLLGVGLGNFGSRLHDYVAHLPPKIARMPEHRPHSFALGLAAETGLIGLGLFLLVCALTVTRLVHAEPALARFGLALLALVLVHASFHNIVPDPLLWLVIGLCLAIGGSADYPCEPQGSNIV